MINTTDTRARRFHRLKTDNISLWTKQTISCLSADIKTAVQNVPILSHVSS